MIRHLWALSVHTRAFLRRYMLANILLDAVRNGRGLRGMLAMLLAVPCLLVASTFITFIADGGPV